MAAGGDTAYWLVLLALLCLAASQFWKERLRRNAINQALHEIRRPLQSLALAERGPAAPGAGAVWQAIRAVGQLDQELNGGPRHGEPDELVACRLMSDACIRRCGPRARLAGARIHLRWTGPDALIRGDGAALAAALENLLLNAIEHGGPEITVNALTVAKRLRIEVIDSGGRQCLQGRRSNRRHGHGLRVARRAAEGHGGRLSVEITERGSKAALVLPVNEAGASRDTAVQAMW